jgi:sulfur-carrier protein
LSTTLSILFFGQLAELTGTNKIAVPAAKDTDALMQQLFRQYPSLQQASFVVAVDREIIKENTVLKEETEIALLPPYAGG